jgi:DNA (cytosine-5)-methyltransferase 1
MKRGGFPRAARFDGATRRVVDIGAFPVWADRRHLHQFLRHPGSPLSIRATAGFLSRAEASRLRFAPGFLDAVRSHLEQMQGIEIQTRLRPKSRKTGRNRTAQKLIAAE